MDILIIIFAEYALWGVGAVAVVLWYCRPAARTTLALQVLIALPLAYALARLAGMFWSHEQPFAIEGTAPLIPHEVDNAFPSDHAAAAGALAGVAWVHHRTVGLVLWIATAGIAAARVAAGLHYPIDVLVAAGIAVVAAAIAVYSVRLLQAR